LASIWQRTFFVVHGVDESGKPALVRPSAPRDHARYLEAWIDALGLHDVVLAGIDWGASLGFDWARRHSRRVRGIAFMETIVKPLLWADFPAVARPRFEAFRTLGQGEKLVMEENQFLDGSLRATVLMPLTDVDRSAYHDPFPTPESRRPLLAWPRAMPIEGCAGRRGRSCRGLRCLAGQQRGRAEVAADI
jgi:haloalkane dehalogenase